MRACVRLSYWHVALLRRVPGLFGKEHNKDGGGVFDDVLKMRISACLLVLCNTSWESRPLFLHKRMLCDPILSWNRKAAILEQDNYSSL